MSGSVTKRFNSEQAAKEWLRNHSYRYLSQTWNGSKFTWELKIVSENG